MRAFHFDQIVSSIGADLAARVCDYHSYVIFARIGEGMDNDGRSLSEIVTAVTKVKGVFGDRVNCICVGRTTTVKLHDERFVSVVSVGRDARDRRGVGQAKVCRAECVAATSGAVRDGLVAAARARYG